MIFQPIHIEKNVWLGANVTVLPGVTIGEGSIIAAGAVVELAKTDEEAARKLAEKRKYQSEATVKCYQKLKADAEAGDPEAIKRYEAHLAKRREDYHKKKAEQENIPA